MKRTLLLITTLAVLLSSPLAQAAGVAARLPVLDYDFGLDGARVERAVPRISAGAKHDGPAGLGLPAKFEGGNREAIVVHSRKTLPGRAAKLVLWFRGNGLPWQIRARVDDRGEDGTNRNREGMDTQMVTADKKGWQEVILTLPGDGNGIENAGGTKGQVDYPLELANIQIWEPADGKIHSKPIEAPDLALDSVAVITTVKPDLAVGLTAEPAPGRQKVRVSFTGVKIFDEGRSYRNVAWSFAAPSPTDPGKPVTWQVVGRNHLLDGTCSFRVSYAVRDYIGAVVAEGEFTLDAAAGGQASRDIIAQPKPAHSGPFYVEATWQEAATAVSGIARGRQGRGNARRRMELFETVVWPEGHPNFSVVPEARRTERRGLRVALTAEENKPPAAQFDLNRVLDGRPTALGIWIRGQGKPVRLFAHLRDRTDNVQQRDVWDSWTVGPVTVASRDWQFVQIPVPEFGRPKVRESAKAIEDHESMLDYPLTLAWLRLEADEEATVFVDDLSLSFHEEADRMVRVWSISDKISNLLYRNDRLDVALANADLANERELSYAIALELLGGSKLIEDEGTVRIAAGSDAIRSLELRNAPVGAYRLKVEVREGDRTVYENVRGRRAQSPDPSDVYVVYEPTGQPLDPAKLNVFLKDRAAVLKDLDIDRDIILCAWHSVDGSPAVEPEPGFFTFEFLQEPVAKRLSAGVEPVGRLGFTTLWADPGHTYSIGWFGSTYVFPSKAIYWEEYVRRTVEHMGDRIKTWIVWDQPDSGALGADPQEYLERLLEPASKQIRRVQPDATIISGAISRHNIEKYVQGMAEIGAHRQIDRIGLLPTTSPLSPEDGYLDVLLRRAQRIRRKERVQTPFAVLDMSYITGRDGRDRVSEFDQAVYVPRAYVICRSVGIDDFWLEGGAPENKPSKRDSSEIVFWDNGRIHYKPAALSCSFFLKFLRPARFVREVFLNDRHYHKARAYLFEKGESTILVAWRQDGTSALHLPPDSGATLFYDYMGNASPAGAVVRLSRAPVAVAFEGVQAERLRRALELADVEYDDEPQSKWKSEWVYALDVGDPENEKRFDYRVESGKAVGPIDSYYHNEYGRHVIDSGYHYDGSERFVVDVRPFGKADMIIRKRINYSVPDQVVDVFCDGAAAGTWMSFKRDRRNVWRDQEFIVPNRLFAGKERVELKFVAKSKRGATSYYYRVGPLKTNVMYLSDVSFLVGSSGYGPFVTRDANVLGGRMAFHNPPSECSKGLGTNAADRVAESLVVVSLNRQFKRFRATVGVDAATNGRGSVRFSVGVGRGAVFDSGDMTFYSEAKEIDVDVSDAEVLMLMVTDTGDGRKDDVANWADARLELK